MLLPLVSYYLVGKVPVPDSIVIDPINICNLHCPLCPTGLGMQNYEGHAMPLDMFKSIIGKLPRLKKIGLYNWGEPFLNPDIFDMISYAEERNVEVSIHTNFSLKMNSAFFVNIVKSNLSRLTVSLDGASQETYSKYRIGGDYELAIANIRALVAAKKQCMSKTPVITWQFIVNRFNESEIKKAEEMAAAIGIDFSATGIGLSDDLPDLKLDASIGIRKEAWLPTNKEFIIPWYRPWVLYISCL